jgi:hypothetical protein
VHCTSPTAQLKDSSAVFPALSNQPLLLDLRHLLFTVQLVQPHLLAVHCVQSLPLDLSVQCPASFALSLASPAA